jgi:2-furoate---CoA ligase
MPLYHTMGVRSLLAMALVDGAFVCMPRFDAGACLELIERERVTNLYLVPTLYHDLLAHPAFIRARVRERDEARLSPARRWPRRCCGGSRRRSRRSFS